MKFVVVFIVLIFSLNLIAQDQSSKRMFPEELSYLVESDFEVINYMRYRTTHYLYKNFKKIDCNFIDKSFEWYLDLIRKLEKRAYPKDKFLEVICREEPSFCPYYKESLEYYKLVEIENKNIGYDFIEIRALSLINPNFPLKYSSSYIHEMRNNPVFEHIYTGDSDRASAIEMRHAQEMCVDYIEVYPLLKMKDINTAKGEKISNMIRESVSHYSSGDSSYYDQFKKAMKVECDEFNDFSRSELYFQIIQDATMLCSHIMNIDSDDIVNSFCRGKNPFLCFMKNDFLKIYKPISGTQKFYTGPSCHEGTFINQLCY